MKALVIGPSNIRYLTHLFFYFEQLSRLNYDITLFYWDRDGNVDRPLPIDVKSVCYKKNMKNYIPKIKKVFNFIGYRIAALKVINSGEYDIIIITNAQLAVLLSDILLKKYKNRYIFDYRDPSLERFSIFKKRLASIVLNARANFVSSDAYRELLPKCENIYTMHNITPNDSNYRVNRRELPRKVEKIRISFWGFIRDTDVNLTLVKELGNDDRFELHYYGAIEQPAEDILNYCRQFSITNVYMHGEYLQEERYDFIRRTDIVHNALSNIAGKNPRMTNKFNDGIIFYIPQICLKGGYMGEKVEELGIGFTIDPAVPFGDKLYNYYNDIDWMDFEKKCDSCLEVVLNEQERCISALYEALSDNCKDKN